MSCTTCGCTRSNCNCTSSCSTSCSTSCNTGCGSNSCCTQPGSCTIPHYTVATAADMVPYRCAYVYVQDERTTYHIDNTGNPFAVSKDPLFQDNYIPAVGDFKGVTVYDFANNIAYIYNGAGLFLSWAIT